MKSQRLKNFCQVCRKQCKDQNGYHCHLNSGHHQKKLRELATNPQEHIQKYSKELENKIIQMLKLKYPGQPKNVQDIYDEYTEDKHHIRFNHTKWRDLPQFIEHLKKTGRNIQVVGKIPNCKITYLVNRSGDFIKKKREQELLEKKEKQKEIMQTKLEQRMAKSKEIQEEIFKQMKKRLLLQQQKLQEISDDKFELKLSFGEHQAHKRSALFDIQETQKQIEQDINNAPRKIKNVEKLFQRLENKQKIKKKEQTGEEQQEDQYQWLTAGIMVKILPHEIPQAFHGKKTAVLSVDQPFVATVKMGSANLQIDQTYLQTVIPKPGHQVKVLRGDHRGKNGILQQINVQQGTGIIQIEEKEYIVPFNQFSKCA